VSGLLEKSPDDRRPRTAQQVAESLEASATALGWRWRFPEAPPEAGVAWERSPTHPLTR
jgi:hypothetical protein